MRAVTVEARAEAWHRDVGTAAAQRRPPGGGGADAVHRVPFAFASRAFHPGASIRHVE